MHYLSKCEDATCGKTYPADLHNCPHCGADSAFSSIAPLDPRDWGWDIETYPNIFTASFIHAATGIELVFEISDRKNEQQQLIEFVFNLGRSKARGIGFNNLAFDYPVLHYVVNAPGCTLEQIYAKAQSQIKPEGQWPEIIWDRDQIFEQIDLYKIHHFDNKARRTSLKALEVGMQSPNVKDLPFPVGMVLNDQQKDILIDYNKHDVRETLKFFVRSLDKIHFREELTKQYGRNFMNHADTKIGKDIFVHELEKAGVDCSGVTIRERIALTDVIPSYVKLETTEFTDIMSRMKSVVLTKKQQDELLTTKGVFSDMVATVDGIEYTFGLGGIHSGIPNCIYKSDDGFVMSARDVTSLYPNLSIRNRFYPEHLGETFCDVYENLFNRRRDAKRAGDKVVDATLKLALNGTFGNMGSRFSPFCDHKCLLSITITGQLSMAMLVEQLRKVPQMTIVQTNTDGLILHHPAQYLEHVDNVCQWWMDVTQLNLECEDITSVYQRDVNNYIQVGTNGKIKRKGAYEYNYQWHQDPSAMIVARAAEAALVHGEDIRTFITQHRDPFDFMLRAKVPRSARLVMRWPEWGAEQEMQNTTRVFISRNGGSLVKLLPPTGTPGTWKRKNGVKDDVYNAVMREITGQPGDLDSIGTPWDERIHTKSRSKHDAVRETGMYVGWKVTECADAKDFDWGSLDYEYYVKEAEKLVLPLLGVTK